MDLVPTLMELAGMETTGPESAPLDGLSLKGLLFEGRALPQRSLFWRARQQRAVRRGHWKLVSLDRDIMLFNLADDLAEQHDLAAQMPELVQDLLKELAAWEQEVSP